MMTAMIAWPGAPASAKSSEPVVLTKEQISSGSSPWRILQPIGGFLVERAAARGSATKSDGGVCDGPSQVALAKKAGYSAAGAAYDFNSNSDGPNVSSSRSFPSASAATRYVKLARAQVAVL